MTSNIEEYLQREFAVSRGTYEKLERYAQLLKERNDEFNLIGRGTIDHIWERHIVDSLQLTKYLNQGDCILDFGSGAGLPGIILAIAGFETISVESIAKKCSFQQEIVDELGLNCQIVNERIENFHVKRDLIITARAVAPLKKIFSLSHKHIEKAQKSLFLKGRNYKKEISEAEKFWNFKYKTYKSMTSDESVIIEISGLKWKLSR